MFNVIFFVCVNVFLINIVDDKKNNTQIVTTRNARPTYTLHATHKKNTHHPYWIAL